ncbi:MAG TPA: hypothetical protein DEA91_18130 [Paenibacillus sp.]|nr:hypothetical protein [Paenibacillus sp.]
MNSPSDQVSVWVPGVILQSKILRKVSQAFEALERALKLAELEGYIRIFLDEGMPLIRLLQRYLLDQRTTIAEI